MIDAVLFDLDDTLFAQRHWLDGAWRAVADEAARHGVPRASFHRALRSIAAEGSARGRIIDRALARVGAEESLVAPLVESFLSWRPPELPPARGARRLLAELRTCVAVALVTDGDPRVQLSKVEALGLETAFDVVVLSDELGRDCRKPHPAPFHKALDELGLTPGRAVYVGDRPDKDVAGARAVGMRAVRVLTGEYRHLPDEPRPWATVDDLGGVMGVLRPVLPAAGKAHAQFRD